MSARVDASTETGGLNKVSAVIRLLRSLNSEMQLQQVDVLMIVAQNPGVTVNDIQKKAGLSQSAASRNILALSEWRKAGEPGFNLVESVRDPREPRRSLVFLKPAGKAFITKLVRSIEPSFSIDRDTDARIEVENMHKEAAEAAAAQREKDRVSAKAKR